MYNKMLYYIFTQLFNKYLCARTLPDTLEYINEKKQTKSPCLPGKKRDSKQYALKNR